MESSKEDMKMKLKVMYIFIITLGVLSTVWLVQSFKNEELIEMEQISGEVILLSDEITATEENLPENELQVLKTEIDAYKALIQSEVALIIELKDQYQGDYSTLSQQQKIYLRISLLEVRKYREGYQNTIGSIETLIEPYYGQFDQLSDEEIETLKSEIETIMTYRLVLLEKAYDELVTIKTILLNE
jgi:hypothetical protein